jgi:hypothetical protein
MTVMETKAKGNKNIAWRGAKLAPMEHIHTTKEILIYTRLKNWKMK